jgi:hypothetical protein
MRAAMTPWIESGTVAVASRSVADQPSSRSSRAPCSTSIASISSTKNGFPSAGSRIAPATCAGAASVSSSAPRSVAACCGLRGASVREEEASRPVPHDGLRSSNSGRAEQRMSTAVCSSPATRSSSRSNSGSDAQWMSSMTSTSSASRPSAARYRVQASCSFRSTPSSIATPVARPGRASPMVQAIASTTRSTWSAGRVSSTDFAIFVRATSQQ